MALSPWTVELLRRGLTDVARRAGDPETLDKLKQQATAILQDLPETAARSIDAVMRSAEAGKKSVQRWSRKHTALSIPVLNASGVLLSEFGSGVPVCEEAVAAGQEFLRGDCVGGLAARQRVALRLRRCLPAGGGHTIAVASNFAAAMTAFSMLVEQRPIVVHRSHAVRLPGGLPLPEAFGTLLPVVQEVGGLERAEVRDFASFESCCVVWADGGAYPLEWLDFGEQNVVQAVVLPVATFHESPHESIPSAEMLLSQGFDVILMPGGGIAGGPDCGLLIGREEIIDQITTSPVWPALQANQAIEAMMAVTLETTQKSPQDVPIRALLETGEQNLRARAERMATRLSGSDQIAHVQVMAHDARVTPEGRWRVPSRQVRLKHQSWSAEKWRDTLREEMPAVIVGIEEEEVLIDLRWIAAADDAKLAALVAGEHDETGAESRMSPSTSTQAATGEDGSTGGFSSGPTKPCEDEA